MDRSDAILSAMRNHQAMAQSPSRGYSTPSTAQCLSITLNDGGEIEIKKERYYSDADINKIIYDSNTLTYVYDEDKEEITVELEQDLVKVLYHKINAEIKKQEAIIDKKKSKMKGFSKYLRLDKLKRILGDDDEV